MVWGCHLLEITYKVWNFLRFSHETMREVRCQKWWLHTQSLTHNCAFLCLKSKRGTVAVLARWLLTSEASFRSLGNTIWDLSWTEWYWGKFFFSSGPTSVFPRKSLFSLLQSHLPSTLRNATGLNSEHSVTASVRSSVLFSDLEPSSEYTTKLSRIYR
jgi:hypothetical protein